MNAVARSLLAFAAMPLPVAYIVPVAVGMPPARGPLWPGLAAVATGSIALLACAVQFHRQGRGTLAPWHPTRELVTTGLYRFCRNPMYAAVLLVVAGWALAFRSGWLLAYAGLLAVAFHVRVVFFEEPALRSTHGPAWIAYCARVRRW